MFLKRKLWNMLNIQAEKKHTFYKLKYTIVSSLVTGKGKNI